MPACRFCGAPLSITFADLGLSPISNDFVRAERAVAPETFYPLHAYVCGQCFLVQILDFEKPDALFSDDYTYFSSYSNSWLEHAKRYAERAIDADVLGGASLVVEVASNDGYLLQYFKAAGVPVLGIEPTANTARVALEERGVESEIAFFGRDTATRLRRHGLEADLMVANNVLAHVPDINDFVAGFKILLTSEGVANFEFPHLLRLIEYRQFDTIYHEHFSYLSLGTASRIFSAHGLRIFDVEELSTHGGSLRLSVCHAECGSRHDTARVAAMLDLEARFGLTKLETYENFFAGVIDTKCALLDFLISARRAGKLVAAYGAPAKGNTLLNFCGVRTDLLAFTVDRSPHKIGKLLPGTRIPVFEPEAIFERRPDYVLILPWNLTEEIVSQMAAIRDWGGRFVTPIPQVEILP